MFMYAYDFFFFLANPNALLNTVWLNNGVHYGFRGRQEHTNLRLGDLKLLKDGSGTEYVEFYGMFNYVVCILNFMPLKKTNKEKYMILMEHAVN